MNAVREWTTVICLAALAGTLLQNLTPNGNMERTARLVIGAFLLCAFLYPMTRLVPQLTLELQSEPAQPDTTLQSTVENQSMRAVESSVKNLVAAELQRLGLFCENVSVVMDTDGEGRIGISKVVVRLTKDSAGGRSKADARLREITGLEMEVTVDGG